MKAFIGSKIILAERCSKERFEFEKDHSSECEFPEFQTNTPGYRVAYPPLRLGEKPYISWSPLDVFENAYREVIDSEAEAIASTRECAKSQYGQQTFNNIN